MPSPRNAAAVPPHADAACRDARAAGLRHVDDGSPGIARLREDGGFRYVDPQGKPVADEETLARIKSLAIPPAWNDVWICRWANGHIQATGRDARGRKQYRYHPQWRSVRDEVKYGRMLSFGRALPALRGRVEQALKLPGLPREKVLAAIVCLLQVTLMRVGNREYARSNDSFGMTTLRKKHVRVDGSDVRFEFRGKSGVRHSITLHDRRLARIIRGARELPGQELFQYVDETGERHAIGSADVNDYLRELTGEDYTAKDFRTWSGTLLAAAVLGSLEPAQSEAHGKRQIAQAVEMVAKKLGNTPAVCRKCYVHPCVLDAYLDGSLQAIAIQAGAAGKAEVLDAQEAIVLALLEQASVAPTGNGEAKRARAAKGRVRRRAARAGPAMPAGKPKPGGFAAAG